MTADLKALHRALVDAVFSGDDPRAIEPFVAPMHELHQSAAASLPPGRGGAFWAVEKLRTAFGKAYVQVDQQIQTGDLVYTRVTARLKHTGRLAAARPTGEWVSLTAMAISRFENGKARETWIETNDLDLLRQLDAFRVKPEARTSTTEEA